jgi:type II secretory pathway component PulK
MLYPVALTMVAATIGAIVHRMLTGKNPESLQDYLFPQNGQRDKDGRAQRLALPTYMKDVVSDWKDFPDYQKMGSSFYHKLNPYVAVDGGYVAQPGLLRGRDPASG